MDGTSAGQGGDNNPGWIGVDLDGTLAHYDHWRGEEHIGPPIEVMRVRVLQWLSEGKDVRIFTARVSGGTTHIIPVQAWCQQHLGCILPVTNVKDYSMDELWDDRARHVGFGTGFLLAACPEHRPIQHRDGKPAWCRLCGKP